MCVCVCVCADWHRWNPASCDGDSAAERFLSKVPGLQTGCENGHSRQAPQTKSGPRPHRDSGIVALVFSRGRAETPRWVEEDERTLLAGGPPCVRAALQAILLQYASLDSIDGIETDWRRLMMCIATNKGAVLGHFHCGDTWKELPHGSWWRWVVTLGGARGWAG